jgi:alpha-glucoside transport system ATP-binding protein
LFDEPLSNLDAALRVKTRLEIANLKESMPDTTMIYVTHDQVEAMTLADRIVVLSAGKIEQVGSPLELYTKPANLFVAQFIGSPAMNILQAEVNASGENSSIKLADQIKIDSPIAIDESLMGKAVSFGVRPEDLRLCDQSSSLLHGDISFIEALGEVTMLYVTVADNAEPVVAKLPGILNLTKGDKVAFTADADKLHLFDDSGVSLLYS